MAEFFKRHSLFLSSVALLITSFQLMSNSIANPKLPKVGAELLNTALSPVEEVHSSGLSSIRKSWGHYLWLMGVEEENISLKEKIKVLETKNSELIEYSHENSRLRSLLNYTKEFKLPGIAGTVIGRDPSNWVRSITIDIGGKEGLAVGQPVVDGHAVVGITTVVSEESSKVLLLTDSTSAIDAIVQRTRAPGIVESDAEKHLGMRFVVKEDDVAVGDRIVTSGLDGVFPKGILIGVVMDVDSDKAGLFQGIDLTPSANLDHLENVLVLSGKEAPSDVRKEPTVVSAKDTAK